MARKYHLLRLEGQEYRLRLTLRGQRQLKERFQEETLETVLLAAADAERMCALLGEALNWPESGNAITDGEVFYDLLVDAGYRGQERFGALAFDLAAASGLITEEQARQLKESLRTALNEAFTRLGNPSRESEAGEAAKDAGPFPRS